MDYDIIDCTHPASELGIRIFLVLILLGFFICAIVFKPDDPNIILFSCACFGLIFIMSYFTYRQRSIDFDGNKFYLENFISRKEIIDASLFEKIDSIFISYYKIKFTNGKNYLFTINNSTFYSKAIFTMDTVGYDNKLTAQIKEMIEQHKHNKIDS